MKKFNSKSCEEIMTTVYRPIEFCIDNLLAQGLYILAGAPKWFCQYHLTHFIRTRIMQRERYDHSRAFFGLPEAAHRWRCRFFC